MHKLGGGDAAVAVVMNQASHQVDKGIRFEARIVGGSAHDRHSEERGTRNAERGAGKAEEVVFLWTERFRYSVRLR